MENPILISDKDFKMTETYRNFVTPRYVERVIADHVDDVDKMIDSDKLSETNTTIEPQDDVKNNNVSMDSLKQDLKEGDSHLIVMTDLLLSKVKNVSHMSQESFNNNFQNLTDQLEIKSDGVLYSSESNDVDENNKSNNDEILNEVKDSFIVKDEMDALEIEDLKSANGQEEENITLQDLEVVTVLPNLESP